jgi:hypothetical protein
MNTALPWILFVIGVFYSLGGIVLVRRMAMDQLLDKAIAAITLKRDRVEEAATRLLTIGAWLTLASGLTLMAQSRATLVIFGLNIAVQAGYLIWAARARPPENDLERRGRQATTNALFIYVGVFGLALIMEQQGLWRELLGSGWAGLAAETLAALLVTAAFAWLIWNPPGAKRQSGFAATETPEDDYDDGLAEYDPGQPPSCLRLAPEYNCWPTWDDETFSNVDPDSLGLSAELGARIRSWDALFQNGYKPDDPFNSGFASLEEERLWTDQAEAVWQGLLEEWQGPAVNKVSLLPYLVDAAREGLSPYEFPDEARLQKMAENCRLLEVRDMLARLDTLAAQREATEAWDGDTQDDIARAQTFFARVLARVAPQYRADVARGLESAEEETRRWVQLALDGQAG